VPQKEILNIIFKKEFIMNDQYLNWVDKNGIRSMDVIKMTRPDLIRQTGIDKIPDLVDPIKVRLF
jgi:protein tyrosine phosphatase